MCGTCAGICPVSAITMKLTEKGIYAPTLQPSLCTQCGRCIQTCPGIGINANAISSTLFQAPSQKFRRDLGNYIGCYYGHANDSGIRQQATSGGAVTALLIYLLEHQLINGALVTKSDSENPLETETFIARSVDDLRAASTSRYCPTTPNTVLSQILREPGVFAVVGLPCHIHGVRKAEQIYPQLKAKILLHIGLFCSGTPTFMGTYELLRYLGLEIPTIQDFKYRVDWPTTSIITMKNGHIIRHRFQETLLSKTWGLRFYLSPRCMLCFDALNELADIAFGDAHLPRTDNSNTYRSLMITRSLYADEVLHQASSHLHIKALPPSTAAQTQRGGFRLKWSIKARMNLRQIVHKAVPRYDIEFTSPTPLDYGRSLFYYLNMACGSIHCLTKYVPYIAKNERRIIPI